MPLCTASIGTPDFKQRRGSKRLAARHDTRISELEWRGCLFPLAPEHAACGKNRPGSQNEMGWPGMPKISELESKPP